MARVRTVLTSNLKQLSVQARTRAAAAVDKTLHDIEAHAKDHVAVDTGATKNSIGTEKDGALSGRVTVGTDYSEHLEYGTVKAAAQPYMTPAAEENRAPFVQAMKQIV